MTTISRVLIMAALAASLGAGGAWATQDTPTPQPRPFPPGVSPARSPAPPDGSRLDHGTVRAKVDKEIKDLNETIDRLRTEALDAFDNDNCIRLTNRRNQLNQMRLEAREQAYFGAFYDRHGLTSPTLVGFARPGLEAVRDKLEKVTGEVSSLRCPKRGLAQAGKTEVQVNGGVQTKRLPKQGFLIRQRNGVDLLNLVTPSRTASGANGSVSVKQTLSAEEFEEEQRKRDAGPDPIDHFLSLFFPVDSAAETHRQQQRQNQLVLKEAQKKAAEAKAAADKAVADAKAAAEAAAKAPTDKAAAEAKAASDKAVADIKAAAAAEARAEAIEKPAKQKRLENTWLLGSGSFANASASENFGPISVGDGNRLGIPGAQGGTTGVSVGNSPLFPDFNDVVDGRYLVDIDTIAVSLALGQTVTVGNRSASVFLSFGYLNRQINQGFEGTIAGPNIDFSSQTGVDENQVQLRFGAEMVQAFEMAFGTLQIGGSVQIGPDFSRASGSDRSSFSGVVPDSRQNLDKSKVDIGGSVSLFVQTSLSGTGDPLFRVEVIGGRETGFPVLLRNGVDPTGLDLQDALFASVRLGGGMAF